MAALFLLIALASATPTIDIAHTCKSAQGAALPEDQAAAYQSCMHDEQDARDQLKQNWSKYSAAAHAECSEDGGFSPSYVELRTCLEMQPGGSLSMEGVTGRPAAGAAPSGLAPGFAPHEQPKP
jgi:hypothetical protein